jgi:hypothetical protein
MKHLNVKITLLVFTLLLAIGQSKANEPGLFLTNSSVDKFSLDKLYLAKADDSDIQGKNKGKGKKKKTNPNECDLGGDVSGTLCKTGECVASKSDCPKKNECDLGDNISGKLCNDGETCVVSKSDCPKKDHSPHNN